MYAIIETGGKQFRVQENDVIRVEKLELSDGDECVFNNVIAISDGEGGLTTGSPFIKNAAVSGTVIKTARAKKVIVYKYKSKKGFHKKKGHRQPFTEVKIANITA